MNEKITTSPDRFAALVERRLAGLLVVIEREELSRILKASGEARATYLGAVDIHVDLGSALEPESHRSEEEEPMARITLNCTCSWTFFIPGTTTGHEVNCPHCGQSVRIPGRKPGQDQPMSAGAVAAEQQRRQGMLRMAIGAAAALLVAGGVYAIVARPTPATPVAEQPAIQNPIPPPGPQKPKVEQQPSAEIRLTPNKEEPIYNAVQIEELRQSVFENIGLINLSTIVSEIFRYRRQTDASQELQVKIVEYEKKIQSCNAELAKVNQKISLDPYCAAGDQITAFSGRDLRTIKLGEAAQALHQWAIGWGPGAFLDGAVIVRDGREVMISLVFPQDSEKLRSILRHPALRAEVLSNGQASDRIAMSPDLLQRYRAAMEVLPSGYLQFVPAADRKRLQDAVERKMMPTDDVEWFQARVLGELLPAFDADARALKSKLAELEILAKDNPAPDAVFLKDGQRLDGKVIEEGPDKVRVKFRAGARMLMRDEISRIEKGKGIGTEAAQLLETSKGSVEKLLTAMSWCSNKNLTVEKQFAACQALLLDPSQDKARTTLGFRRP